MTNQHPITPSPEMVEKWVAEIWHEGTPVRIAASDFHIATQAAQWGADQELEACCEWLQDPDLNVDTYKLRNARRPKPPSLKEQALEQLNGIATCFRATHGGDIVCDKIRKALEALPND